MRQDKTEKRPSKRDKKKENRKFPYKKTRKDLNTSNINYN